MRVSVVIPTFNCVQYLPEAIESVFAQTHVPHEVIVVDDGSTDGTEEQLRNYAGRIRFFRKENGGVSTARNMALREATGDLIAFLDSDDVWHPRKLEMQVACLRKNPDVGLLGARMIDWPQQEFREIAEEMQEGKMIAIPFETLAVKNVFITSTVVVRRSITEKVGEFDPTLRGPEDYDYWLRCLQVTRTANLNLSLAGYRTVPGSLGQQAISMEAGMRRILEKLEKADLWKGRWLLRRRAYSYFYLSCGYMYYAANYRGPAFGKLLRSFVCYPMPFRNGTLRYRFGRLRLFSRVLWNYLRGGSTAKQPAL
jgi:glycosyltransferase involved in cell wall biosynthesis